MKTSSRGARLELLIIIAIAILLAILELYVDTFQNLVIWAATNEALLVTEILTLGIVLSVGLSIYAWRRWRETVVLEEDRAQLRQTMRVEQDAHRLMKHYAEAVTQGQEAERRRLARELHDDTIQRLIVINQKVELAAFDYAEAPVAQDLHKMNGLIDDTIDHVRQFIQELRPTYLDELGLVTALRKLTKDTRERSDIFIEFEVTGTPCRLNESVELSLYRIVQAALSNVEQHAGAFAAEVRLDFQPEAISLRIIDDGRGFIPTDHRQLVMSGHFGLLGMRERAELLGATYNIRSKPDEGTEIRVCVPLSPR